VAKNGQKVEGDGSMDTPFRRMLEVYLGSIGQSSKDQPAPEETCCTCSTLRVKHCYDLVN
jgi:hypothetical protein